MLGGALHMKNLNKTVQSGHVKDSTSLLAQTILEISRSLALPDQYEELKNTIQNYLENSPDSTDLEALELHSEITNSFIAQTDKSKHKEQRLQLIFELSTFDKTINSYGSMKYEIFQNNILADDLVELKNWFTHCTRQQTTEYTKLVRCYDDTNQKLELYVIKFHEDIFKVYKTIGGLENNIEQILQLKFGLTHSELVVIRGLIGGETPKSIASKSGKSIETIRSQFKSAAAKLGVSRQQEIVNFVHNISRIEREFPNQANQSPKGSSHKLHDGRLITYDIIGDPKDYPVMFVHDFGSGRHWPTGSASLFRKANICVYSVSRAGFGPSTSVKKYGLQLLDSHVDDYGQLMDTFKINKCSFLGFGTGFAVGYRFALKFPNRVDQVIGGDIYPPVSSRKEISNFSSGFFRSSVMAALYAPKTHIIISKIAAKSAASIRSGKDLVKLLDMNLNVSDEELEHIFQTVLKPNVEDLERCGFEGSWRDCSFVPTDWADALNTKRERPKTTLFQHYDFPSVKNEFVENFATALGHQYIIEQTPFAFQFSQAESLIGALSPKTLTY